MRILHLLSQIPARTGSGVYLCNLAGECARRGYAQGAVIGLPAPLTGHGVPGISPDETLEVLFETEDLPYLIPGMSDVMPYPSTVFSTLSPEEARRYQQRFAETVRHAADRFRPDVVLANHLWLATGAAVLTLEALPAARRPAVYGICHGTDLRQMQLSPRLAPLAAEGCRRLDGVFCLNGRQREQIGALYGIPPERLHLAGTGFDSGLFNPVGRSPGLQAPLRLVYAGKLANAKGVPELLAAMALLPADRFHLTLAGSGAGQEAEAILSAVSRSGGQAAYAGMLSQQALAALFRQADLFVLPSYFEGLPLVAAEALACGARVVVNDLPGLREWLGEPLSRAGLVRYVPMPPLIGPDTIAPEAADAYAEALAQAIAALSQEPPPDPAAAEAARAALRRHSWGAVLDRMARVFEQTP